VSDGSRGSASSEMDWMATFAVVVIDRPVANRTVSLTV
jgi:hypothetical protein